MQDREIWKSINNYDYYEISNIGRVRSYYNGSYGRRKEPKILSIKIDRIGYSFIHLKNSEGRKPLRIHRLVAEAFIPNPGNLPEVNHIDENKQNNCVSNLEWSTRLHNIRHSKVWKSLERAINQYDLKHNFIKTWESMSEAARAYKVTPNCIFSAIRDSRPGTGFIWEYA